MSRKKFSELRDAMSPDQRTQSEELARVPLLNAPLEIGSTVGFMAAFEGDTEHTIYSKGTVADVRDGCAYVFVLGYRWPFQIALNGDRVGLYPEIRVYLMKAAASTTTGEEK